jgi:hypothetical protein
MEGGDECKELINKILLMKAIKIERLNENENGWMREINDIKK